MAYLVEVLFGGSYLILLCIGRILAHYNVFNLKTRRQYLIWTVLSGTVWVLWCMIIHRHRTMIDEMFPLGPGFNPPSISLMVLGIVTMFLMYSFSGFLEGLKIRITKLAVNFAIYIGEHTLYIFLYHNFFRDILNTYFYIDNIHFKRVVYIMTVIAAPLCVEQLVSRCIKALRTV